MCVCVWPWYCVHRKCHETLFQGCTFFPSINILAAELWPQQVVGLGLAGRQAEVKGWRWFKTPAPVVTLRDTFLQLWLLRAITRQQSIRTPCLQLHFIQQRHLTAVMSLVSSAVCTVLGVYVGNSQKRSSSLPLSDPTHWPSHTQTSTPLFY